LVPPITLYLYYYYLLLSLFSKLSVVVISSYSIRTQDPNHKTQGISYPGNPDPN
jgi:hypothetical protein